LTRLFLLVLSFPLPAVALADAIGNVSVADGDTLEIRGTKIRLYGSDAPESGQLCRWTGKDYRCGWQAAAVDDRIARRSVRREKRDVGRYGRTIAGCFVGSVSLDDERVKQGWAVAYRE
jgi:endonuclease YncB( thermonuclease family)